MKTSNKILILTICIFVLSYAANMMFMLYSAKAEITKPYNLSGKMLKFDKEIGDRYSLIGFEGNLGVIFKKDTVNRIEIEADKNLISLLNFNSRYDKLYIYTNNAIYRNNTKDIIKIILHLKSFTYINGFDKVSFSTDSIINTNFLHLTLYCNSKANLQLNTETFNCKIGYYSSCNISGKANDTYINLTKESSLSAKEFCTDYCNVNLSKNSNADINVKGSIRKKVSKNSKLNIIGNPVEKD